MASDILASLSLSNTSSEIAKKYIRDRKLGEGTYAVVYLATHIDTQTQVAIKKIKLGQYKDGIDMSAIREIKFLQELHHPNVIRLFDIFTQKQNMNLVLEYLESDLEMVVKDKSVVFMPSDIKSWMVMTCRGLEYCHQNWILHRDLKPNNLLIAHDGTLKIADFGLARIWGEPVGNMTSQVVTRWYRAPELLFGVRDYGYAIDIWALGCIFAELMLRTPYLPGESDMDQLKTIFRALGTPTEKEWPGVTKLPDYIEYTMFPRTPMRTIFTAAGEDALDLLEKMLVYDPLRRPTARQVLEHAYFRNAPRPTLPKDLPRVNVERKIPETETAGHKRTAKEADIVAEGQDSKVARRLF